MRSTPILCLLVFNLQMPLFLWKVQPLVSHVEVHVLFTCESPVTIKPWITRQCWCLNLLFQVILPEVHVVGILRL